MEQKKRMIVLFILILNLAVTTATACGFMGFGGTEKWKEEVQLSDGRVIVIERERMLESGGDEWSSNRRGLKPKEHYIKFVNPDRSGKMIEWQTIKKSPRKYPEIPLVLNIDSGYLVIFTLVGVGPDCEVYNKYIYQNGVWSEETLPEKFEPKITNLLVRNSEDVQKYINLKTKQKEIEDSRRAVRQVGPIREVFD